MVWIMSVTWWPLYIFTTFKKYGNSLFNLSTIYLKTATIYVTQVCKQPRRALQRSPVDRFPLLNRYFHPEFFYFPAFQTLEHYLRQPLLRDPTALMTATPAVTARNRACFPPYWRNQQPMFGAPVPARPRVSQTHRPNTRPRPEWVRLGHSIPFDLCVPFRERRAQFGSLELINTTGAFIRVSKSFEKRPCNSLAFWRCVKRGFDFWKREEFGDLLRVFQRVPLVKECVYH